MDQLLVIDKDYVFSAVGSGWDYEVTLHVQCNHEEAMMYGEYFSENDLENDEVDVNFDIKDRLDETVAAEYAENFFQEWKENNEEAGEQNEEDEIHEELTLEDFIDKGWDAVAELFYYYRWSHEFKKDCLEYYQKNKLT